ncbi:hypothetical protein [Streptomyces sp. OK228]|uniref:hypothetical protein n=1 Tax=Streptomyces sp. OK228 TaxID=1882786 RepID=UPI000BDA92F9|nr:hypothetical protein [Streptomyces sp. OK228]SOE25604.1 hypothetical protein SAMN05442782_2346 [Streptomyces sp. OK228]
MLARHTSRELAEWAAYERYAGPIDRSYDQEALAAIHEQLQAMNHLLGAAHFTDKQNTTNPVSEPERYPRSHELYQRASEQGDDN